MVEIKSFIWSQSHIYRSRFVPSFLCPGHNTLGCAMSHRRVYEKIVAEKWPCAMVFAPWIETAEPSHAEPPEISLSLCTDFGLRLWHRAESHLLVRHVGPPVFHLVRKTYFHCILNLTPLKYIEATKFAKSLAD